MTVRMERRDMVAVVIIDRPDRRNALDAETIAGLGRSFTAAETDSEISAVVLTGAGDRAFCAGADLKDRGVAVPGAPGLEVFTTRCYPKPVIAAVNGAAVGGGLELMLACDMAVAADHVVFSVPEVLRGVVGAGCTTRLASRLPPAIVAELVLTGGAIDAARARDLGLVNEVVAASEVVDVAVDLARRASMGAPLALRLTKELLWRERQEHGVEEWKEIRALAAPVFSTEDAAEGRAAFADRRAPRWRGR